MNRKTINTVIVLGILSLISVVSIQLFWVHQTNIAQKTAVKIQMHEDSLQTLRFSERVRSALRNVLEQVTKQEDESADLYGKVNQKNTNYFKVDIVEELHPYYLEQLLKREFDKQNLRQDFIYGIYDCFTDSIVFGNLIKYSEDSAYSVSNNNSVHLSKDLKWKNDGHYFTVLFPNIKKKEIVLSQTNFLPWISISGILLFLLLFFLFTLNVILKQKRLSEVKTDFINNMTHELKTPISTIGLSSDFLLKMKGDNEEMNRVRRYAEIIFKENKRLESQVENVLHIAKMEKNKLALTKEFCLMHDLIRDAKDSFDMNLAEKGGAVELIFDAENDHIPIDETHVTNVLYNLMDNAVKYCKENPLIRIHTQSDKHYFYLTISDNGIGIKKEDIKMIFDKFFRVSTGNIHDVKGYGLGLFYVKLIVEEHGGQVQVTSEYGKGTSFRLTFPLV